MAQRWDDADDAAPHGLAARCVILRAPDAARHGARCAAAPAELLDSLRRRGIEAEDAAGPYAAFASLCAAAAETSGDAPAPVALIVVEPRAATPGDWLARLAGAIARYAPGTPIWRYERDANPRLRPLEALPHGARERAHDADAARAGGGAPERGPHKPTIVVRSGVAPGVARPARPPALRLSPEPWPEVAAAMDRPMNGAPSAPRTETGGGADAAQVEARTPAPTRLHDLVSEEELAMLLADDAPALRADEGGKRQ